LNYSLKSVQTSIYDFNFQNEKGIEEIELALFWIEECNNSKDAKTKKRTKKIISILRLFVFIFKILLSS